MPDFRYRKKLYFGLAFINVKERLKLFSNLDKELKLDFIGVILLNFDWGRPLWPC